MCLGCHAWLTLQGCLATWLLKYMFCIVICTLHCFSQINIFFCCWIVQPLSLSHYRDCCMQTFLVSGGLVWADDDVDELLVSRQPDVLLLKVLIRTLVDHQKIQLVSTSPDHFRHPTVVFPFHVHPIYLQCYEVGLMNSCNC